MCYPEESDGFPGPQSDRAACSNSMNDTTESVRSGSDPIISSAFRFPRKQQIRMSVSKITEAPAAQFADVTPDISQVTPVSPHAEGLAWN